MYSNTFCYIQHNRKIQCISIRIQSLYLQNAGSKKGSIAQLLYGTVAVVY